MKKTEIKEYIGKVIDVLQTLRDTMNDMLEPYEKVDEVLDKLEAIEEEYGIDTGIDAETVIHDTLRSCIDDSGAIEDMHDVFEEFYDALVEWQDEVGIKKAEEIEEKYIEVLAEIKEIYDIYSIEEPDDFDDQLNDMIEALKNMEE